MSILPLLTDESTGTKFFKGGIQFNYYVITKFWAIVRT